jgi:predicted small lipoprotein YifL
MGRLIAIVLVVTWLTACGTKGPLYLPAEGSGADDKQQRR